MVSFPYEYLQEMSHCLEEELSLSLYSFFLLLFFLTLMIKLVCHFILLSSLFPVLQLSLVLVVPEPSIRWTNLVKNASTPLVLREAFKRPSCHFMARCVYKGNKARGKKTNGDFEETGVKGYNKNVMKTNKRRWHNHDRIEWTISKEKHNEWHVKTGMLDIVT